MRLHSPTVLAAMALLVFATVADKAWAANFGTPISEVDLATWDIDIATSTGDGLPDGQGTVAEGAMIFEEKCAVCHGEQAEGGPMYNTMVGGIGSMTEPKRTLTPGSMYPYAPILFDYVRRAMPMDAPQSLTDNEVYALTGFIYNLNGLVAEDATVDAEALKAIEMPNRDGFVVDDRPDVSSTRCMSRCPPLEPILK